MRETKKVSIHGFQQFYFSFLFSACISAGLFSGSGIYEKCSDLCGESDLFPLGCEGTSILPGADVSVHRSKLCSGLPDDAVQKKKRKDRVSDSRDDMEHRLSVRV